MPLLHLPGGMSKPLPLLFGRRSGIDGRSSRGEVYSVSVLFFCASYNLLPCWLIWIDVLVRELLRHWEASQALSSFVIDLRNTKLGLADRIATLGASFVATFG